MPIASTVRSALREEQVEYRVLHHPPVATSSAAAEVAHVSGHQLAKAVLLKDQAGFLLAVLPASNELDMASLSRKLHRRLRLATEEDLDRNFFDCELGAVPPLGPWYRLPTVIDEALRAQPEIYFEAGDHRELIQVENAAFERLVDGAEYLSFSHRRN
jgi:Ala-tRNA(Pro) deacylase